MPTSNRTNQGQPKQARPREDHRQQHNPRQKKPRSFFQKESPTRRETEESHGGSLDQWYAKLVALQQQPSSHTHRQGAVDPLCLLETRVWPALTERVRAVVAASAEGPSEFKDTTRQQQQQQPDLRLEELIHLAAVLLSNSQAAESGVPLSFLDFVIRNDRDDETSSTSGSSSSRMLVWETFCQHLFGKQHQQQQTDSSDSRHPNDFSFLLWTAAIHCFDLCFNALTAQHPSTTNTSCQNHQQLLWPALEQHTRDLYRFMPPRARELYIRQQQQPSSDSVAIIAATMTTATTTTSPQSFLVDMIQYILHLMEGPVLAIRSNSNRTTPERPTEETAAEASAEDPEPQPSDDENHDSDDLNDSENEEGLDGSYNDDYVPGTDYRYGVGTDEKQQQQQQEREIVADNDESIQQPDGKDIDDDDHDAKQQQSAWTLIHRALELLCDLLLSSSSNTAQQRQHLVAYLTSIHWTVRCRQAIGMIGTSHSTATTTPPDLLLAQQLLERVAQCIGFTTTATTAVSSSSSSSLEQQFQPPQRRALYHPRARMVQKLCHRHFAATALDLIYAGPGLLCVKPFLRQTALAGWTDADLVALLYRLRLVEDRTTTTTYSRDVLVQILEEYLVIPPDPLKELQQVPLYPTERVLWDVSRIPPSQPQQHHGSGIVLALPKLHTSFLSFPDYLWRNLELVRLESAYEIRVDLTDVIRRVRPVLRQALLEDREEQYQAPSKSSLSVGDSAGGTGILFKTEFLGWARMALELQRPLELKRVDPPLLGQTVPAQVVAEITIDLAKCGDSLRREWDGELGEFDNLFLVGLDARQMSGRAAPRIPGDPRGRSVPDEDDPSFPSRFGVTLVRGCMILHVRDQEGTILSDPTNEKPAVGTKRIFRVALDPTQYSQDAKSRYGTDMYNGLNLVVRRHGRANNFRSVLETIRGLMAGTGSIQRVLPAWLQPVLLGQGDPREATCRSDTMQAYARATAGVSNPDTFLDYGDTFLDEAHLRSSFADSAVEILVDGRKELFENDGDDDTVRRCYRIRMAESEEGTIVEAVSYPFPEGAKGNPVRFTPLQVAAIHSGLSPGLSLTVGPPGTGKTDVAVQIIASLYHSFPTQRTIVITHSNAALNDIFQKVMARGDLEERYLVRLGAGERELETESTHDFTKQGRVAYSLARRGVLLEQVQQLSESLGISGRAERGADGSPSYTCETAEFFHKLQVQRRIRGFHAALKKGDLFADDADVSPLFPFAVYFKLQDKSISLAEANAHFESLGKIFRELAEYRPLELLRTQRQRSDYLIMKQARVVAMTCTHAAIARSHLIELGFEYDNVVIEEAGQMLEIETFIPLLLQRGHADGSTSGSCRLKRVSLMGDHNQLPPVIQNMTFAKYSNLDQSMFARLIRWGVPYIQLDKQGRARPEIARLYSWRYRNLGNLSRVSSGDYNFANPGFAHTFQLINIEDFEGKGETSPTAYFFQNVGEAEYAVALFQYMVLIGYSPHRISILTTYNGQKALIQDILSQRCGPGTPLADVRPQAVSSVDQYQGQQNDVILLSLVRTESVGHLRDVRRLVVAVSRARLGLYVLARQSLFGSVFGLHPTFDQFTERPSKLQLVLGENAPTERKVDDEIPADQLYEVDDVAHMGAIVHQMQEEWMNKMSE